MNLASSELKVNKKLNDVKVSQKKEIDIKNCHRKHFYLPNRD